MSRKNRGSPLVKHVKRHKHDVYIGRPSKWGNPFVIGVDGSRSDVVAKYAQHLANSPELCVAAREELRGKVLGCYCYPKMCHGNILAYVAEGASPAEALELVFKEFGNVSGLRGGQQ